MDLSNLRPQFQAIPEYKVLLKSIQDGEPQSISLGLQESIRPILAASLANDHPQPILYLVSRAERFLSLSEELIVWDPKLEIYPFPTPGPLFYEQTAWGSRTRRERISALAVLINSRREGSSPSKTILRPQIILAPIRAMMQRTISPETFIKNTKLINVGAEINLEHFLNFLIRAGYEPASIVAEAGQFNRHGGIIDIWPPTRMNPIRIELFGDEIDSIRSFDPASQLSIRKTHSAFITPAREGLPGLFQDDWKKFLAPKLQQEAHALQEYFLPWMNPQAASLLDFIPSGGIILVDDRANLVDAIEEFEEQAIELRNQPEVKQFLPQNTPLPYVTQTEVLESFDENILVDLGQIAFADPGAKNISDSFSPGPRFGGQLRPLMDHIGSRTVMHESVIVVSRQAPRLVELYSEEVPEAFVHRQVPSEITPGSVAFIQGALSEGWSLRQSEGSMIHLLSDAEIFGWTRPRTRRRSSASARIPESQYADLKKGDIVVHVDFGIGRFLGLVQRTLDDLTREYLLVEHAEGDQVYVPIHQADRITRYVSADSSQPKLSRLGSREWQRQKTKAKEAVEEIAEDLLELYASRSKIVGHAFSKDTAWQQELEASFPHIETEEQLRAIEAVKSAMERQQPMDLLVCGDAGYGKTEVALRAAFKAVMDGKQVAMLVPTTVLAQQHYNTFRQRLSAFPVEIEMLSRFRSRAEIRAILELIAKNEVDIVIGTHRLLQDDVTFHDLGLLIIDEEQRFGVTHKEYLKQKRTEVDVLTMTATPIPRTLYMALTGVRDISTINTPPEERLPVITKVGPYDPGVIRQAILRELDRGGQTFFVHNRVLTIGAMKKRLELLVPEANFAIAHGQMPEDQLADVMESFTRGEIEVLVSTSIIESGLDIPNANTLIVDRADRFGMTQLYQLRGRVGRGAARAYAYFLRHPTLRMNDDAYQRLEIFSQHSQLGAGYSIAMRDLELRGAGDILGTRQHGHISAVGFHLYTKLLAAAVRAKSDHPIPATNILPQSLMPLAVTVELPIASAIPSDYVSERELRLQLYRRLAEFRSEDEIKAIRNELDDRFGEPPEEVDNLLFQLKIRIIASRGKVLGISMDNKQILIQLPQELSRDLLTGYSPNIRISRRGLWLATRENPHWKNELINLLEAIALKEPVAA